VARRLWLGFGLVLCLFGATAAFAVHEMRAIERDSASALRSHTQIGERARVMRKSVDDLFTAVVLLGLATYKEDVQFHAENIDRLGAAYRAVRQELLAASDGGAEVPKFRSLLKPLEDAEVVMKSVDQLVKQQRDKAASLEAGQALDLNLSLVTQLTTNMRNEFEYWGKSVDDLLEATRALSLQRQQRLEATAALAQKVVVLASALALVFGAFAAWQIARSVAAPIRQAVQAAERVAQGDLAFDFPVGRTDEIGTLMQALSRMQANLRRLVAEVRDAALSIEAASGEVAAGNLDLSQRTEDTAARLQSTAHSMGPLSNAVRESVDAARGADALARRAAQEAQRGGQVVREVVGSMREISAKSQRISDIIGVIDSIAFQTNILALNAAVEAARAGEQGRGFVVVANEVRALAQRTADAAKDVKALILESVRSVESGEGWVEQAGERMEHLVQAASQVTVAMERISQAMSAQHDRIEQVGVAVVEVDQLTQQNAALVEQSAAAAESLKEQAGRLSGAVSVFRLSASA
jgi:methyl-accepting chemotaxis protein